MPRNGSDIYYIPPGTEGFPDTTIESEKYNNYIHDVETDLNRPRPISAGGTGADDADEALSNLGAEKSTQAVTNYDAHLFLPGSFYSVIGATSAPIAGHAFVGWVVSSDPPATPPTNQNVVVHARDQGDTTAVPGRLYVREKKANVWGPWSVDGFDVFLSKTGGTVTGPIIITNPPVNPTDATNKQYVDSGDAAGRQYTDGKVNKSGDTMSGPLAVFSGGASIIGSDSNSYTTMWGGQSTLAGGGIVLNGGGRGTSYVIEFYNYPNRLVTIDSVGNINTTGNVLAYNDPNFGLTGSGPNRNLLLGSTHWFQLDTGFGMRWVMTNQLRMSLDGGANLIVYGTAAKPGGGSWADSSDVRIKNVEGDYTGGLEAIAKLRPVTFTYKGNDTPEKPRHFKSPDAPEEKDSELLTVPYPNSLHREAAVSRKRFTGLVAQEVETIFPDMVTKRAGYIDGQPVADMRNLDTSQLIFALVNSVKELKARIEALESA